MSIDVSQTDSLIDEQIYIKISSLQKLQNVTIAATIKEQEGEVFVSNGFYTADENGFIDTQLSPSLGGTYSGVDPMGFLASMVPAPHCKPTLRINKKDVTYPHEVELSVLDGHHSIDSLVSAITPRAIYTTCIYRRYMSKHVKRLEIKEGRIRGTLFLPSEMSSYPGVIDLYGSSGRLKETRAALLASRGFTTLALPYFKYSDLPTELSHVSFSYFKEAVEWFSQHCKVNPGGIGVLGISKGGEIGHLMALHIPKIKCVVNINGCPFVCMVDMKEGQDIFHKCVELDGTGIEQTDEGIIPKKAFSYTQDDIIPVWNSDAKILVITGEDDYQTCTNSFNDLYSLYPDDQKDKICIKRYPGAGHLIEPPYTPLCRSSYSDLGFVLFNGGRYPQHSSAQEDAWKRIINFLQDNLISRHSSL